MLAAWVSPFLGNTTWRPRKQLASTKSSKPLHSHAVSLQNGERQDRSDAPQTSPPSAPTPLLDALVRESRNVRANFFCPGHKQGAAVFPRLREELGDAAFPLDMPELPALDNLFAPEGVLEESQELAADTFTEEGADAWNTFFLVNGSTCGVEAAILSTVRPNRKIVLPRNTHQSAVHALVLTGAIPVWIQPLYDAEHDLLHGVSTESIERALDQNKGQVDAVLLISPTYHGACSDVAAIAAITHKHGAMLLVDEAHGSHFAFHDLLPSSATECNADIVVQSTHKTLSALSQAAMMHVRKSSLSRQRVAASLQLVQSTSPNNLLLVSLEAARALMDEQGEDLMSRSIDIARNCAVRIASLKGFSVLGVENVGMLQKDALGHPYVYALDPTRITVLLPDNITGYDMDTVLIDRFGVYAELPSFKHITFVITPGNVQGDINRLVTALALYEATSGEGLPYLEPEESEPSAGCSSFAEPTGLTPRDAFFSDAEVVDSDEAVGRISAESLCPYPPGIPVVVPGERITRECIDVLRAVLDAGGSVSGASDESLSTMRVVANEDKLNLDMS
ncbi:unnamed protein product [Chondrus crispus]|uniref:Orn/Lys/Arg decarboxylases family 1 pyridoxal-P attachment site domain-containing protein n=1 Tax=Chondrus crispus TaxID=2769 RepID=R7QPN1_CHOCR|nr:unnamed protein product [Chondrus crispus]CDF39441.1 unnamed protein product [Chondrus crispus]|eukprot:XP_005719352.1 unnamed protein product [Chondrus crispus]